METTPQLIAIVGPTASGKTSLAISIAKKYDGEIICADSRTIYKDMDIGTAKPTAEEQALVKHWGLDLVDPGESYSAADFQTYANNAINDIRSRGKLPLLVGGTGLYTDAVLYDYTFAPAADSTKRQLLEQMTIEQLTEYCTQNNVSLPENVLNKRHLVRAIERKSVSTINKTGIKPHNYIVGLATVSDILRTRIIQRTEHMFDSDVENEATMLGKKYGWDSEAMTGNIYRLIKQHLEGTKSFDEIKDISTTLDYRLAKRQMTWFRRNPDIMWTTLTGASEYIDSLFARE